MNCFHDHGVQRRGDAQPPCDAYYVSINEIDLGRAAALDVLKHRWLHVSVALEKLPDPGVVSLTRNAAAAPARRNRVDKHPFRPCPAGEHYGQCLIVGPVEDFFSVRSVDKLAHRAACDRAYRGYRTVYKKLRPDSAAKIICCAHLDSAPQASLDLLRPLTFASGKFSDEQMAVVALLVYARRLHRGSQIREAAEDTVANPVRKHLWHATVLDR